MAASEVPVTDGRLRLRLAGPFRLETADGAEVSVKAAKNRGLVALLALAPEGRRSRIWLQDKLWSDRGREQASASLRQGLAQLRDELGAQAGVLSATREDVRLDLRRIDIATTPPRGIRAEFLEGIDVRDPEFEEWLRDERMARHSAEGAEGAAWGGAPAVRSPGGRKTIFLVAEAARRSPERLFEDLFLDCLERSLAESLPVDVYRRAPDASETDPVILIVQCFGAMAAQSGLRVRIEQGRAGRTLWTGMRMVPCRGAPPVDHHEVLSLTFEATEALADSLLLDRVRKRAPLDAALMGRLAIRKIFTMARDEIAQADAMLTEAFGLDPHPNFLAWRIQLRVIQRLERHAPVEESGALEIAELRERAIALDPSNSMVLAASANAKLLIDNDLEAGTKLARASLRMNAANPFAWDCLSIGLLMSGAHEEAHQYQLRANEIASRFPIRHFWEMGACLTSVVTRRTDDAIRLARSASALAPSFRPPLRYLAALHAVAGDAEAAAKAAEKLRRIEPDFSLDRLLHDPSYPITSLRRSGLLESGSLRELARGGI